MSTMTYNSLVVDIEQYLDRSDANLISQIPEFINLGELRICRELKSLLIKTSVTGLFNPSGYSLIKPDRWLQTISFNYGDATGFNTTFRQAAAGVATLTVSIPHNFIAGNSISVFNLGNSAYNGNWTVSSVTQYTITFTIGGGTTESITADSVGIITAPLNNRTTILPRSLEYCNYYWPNRSLTGKPKFYADYSYNYWLIVPTPILAAPFEVVMYQRPIPLSLTNQINLFTKNATDLLLYSTLLETASYLKTDSRIPTWKNYYEEAKMAIEGEDKQRINDSSMMRMERNEQ